MPRLAPVISAVLRSVDSGGIRVQIEVFARGLCAFLQGEEIDSGGWYVGQNDRGVFAFEISEVMEIFCSKVVGELDEFPFRTEDLFDLDHGIAPDKLITVEMSSKLVAHLKKRFPQLKIIQGDAA